LERWHWTEVVAAMLFLVGLAEKLKLNSLCGKLALLVVVFQASCGVSLIRATILLKTSLSNQYDK
jgi:hypothetical protein